MAVGFIELHGDKTIATGKKNTSAWQFDHTKEHQVVTNNLKLSSRARLKNSKFEADIKRSVDEIFDKLSLLCGSGKLKFAHAVFFLQSWHGCREDVTCSLRAR